jgi:hypothetical protein
MIPSLPHALLPLLLAAGAPPAATGAEALDTRLAVLEQQLQSLAGEVKALRAERDALQAAATTALERKVEALEDEVEVRRLSGVLSAPREPYHGLAPSASKVYGADPGVSIGGYGEMLAQAFDSERDDGAASGRKDQLDFLRAVLYFGYKFTDDIVFNSEIEVEHATTGEGDEEKGEVSLEFANVDFLFRDEANLRAGLVLVPMGLVNESHEPTTFLSARRPDVETRIIPSTWREGGLMFHGEAGIFSYRAALLTGLDAEGFSAGSALRDGRQGASRALAEDLAAVARLDLEPVPGLLFGLSAFAGDAGQDAKTPGGEDVDAHVTLWDAHLQYQWKGLRLRGLWSEGRIGDAREVNEANGLVGDDSVGSRFDGWYGEIGWDVLAHLDTDQELVPFVRHEEYDTQARVPDGYLRDPASDRQVLTFGFAYKPHPQVVVKVDWQDLDNEAHTGVDQLNLAVGYAF